MSSIIELNAWEKRREWYSNIQLGKDVATQTNLIKNQTKAMIAAQAATTNAVIASNEYINESINNLSYSIEDIKDGIYGMKAAFEFGISEVIWQIEQNRQVMKDILETLMAPLDTQAKELRYRAEDAYSHGWYEDALEDFLESEKKNKYDFSVQISIGLIYLFHLIDREKSLIYFEKAIKYAKPKSAYHASVALLHAALIYRDYNKLEKAEYLTSEAVDLTPDFSEALYQNSQYNAQLNNASKSICCLRKAIELDKNYCIKANNDEMFDPIRNDVNMLIENLRNDLLSTSSSACRIIENKINNFVRIKKEHNEIFNSSLCNINELLSLLNKLKTMISRNSYYDSLNAVQLSSELSKKTVKQLHEIRNFINYYFEKKSNEIKSEIKNKPFDDEKLINQKIEGVRSHGCLTWFLLAISSLAIAFLIGEDSSTGRFFLFSFGFLFWFGWFVAKGILYLFAHSIYHKKDFSDFIYNKNIELSGLEKYQNEIFTKFNKIL